MAGSGAPTLQVDGSRWRVAIVASQWHTQIMDALVQSATRRLEAAHPAASTLVRVPGAFELPIGAQAVLRAGYDGVVALGVVVRGGTPHFDYVCQAATQGLTQVALNSGAPVGFGLLTVDNVEQALDRAGLPGSSEDKGAEAVEAVLATLDALAAVPTAHRENGEGR